MVVTEDRDFIAIAYSHTPHAGILLLQRPLGTGQYIAYLELMAQITEPDDIRNQLVYCDW